MAVRGWWGNISVIVVTLVVITASFIYFALKIATRSHPKPNSETETTVLDSTHVYRNSFGIPHIVGSSVHDVLFAQGYVHSQDRLWQMDLWRRTGRGRTAEVFGRDGVVVDAFMRSLEVRSIAAQQAKNLSKTSRELLQAYADGVNAYIEENTEKLPFEFDVLGYKPEPWTIEDCLIVGRVMSFELSLAFWSDLAFAQIRTIKGNDLYRRLLPNSNKGPFVLDTSSSSRDTAISSAPSASTSLGALDASPATDMQSTLRAVRSVLGLTGSGYGSNCWAVRTNDGSSIVANDPHLSVSMPAKWYQVHLSAPSLNVVGLSIPGMPLVFSGRNDQLAWGFTNTMADDIDYVLQALDERDPINYYYDNAGVRRKFRYHDDTIRVKDANDTIISLRYTNVSCIISDHHIGKHPTLITGFARQLSTDLLLADRRKHAPTCLALRWTAQQSSDEILAVYKINTASTVQQAVSALSTWGTPALNFTFGSATGQIANVAAGYIPNRGASDPQLPIDGRIQGTDWSGVRNLVSLGTLSNPRRGWVGSANNATSSTAPFITSLYEPNARIVRLGQLMDVYKNPSVRDIQMIQQDLTSPYAQNMLKKTLPVLQRTSGKFAPNVRKALAAMSAWDGTFSPVDKGATIYAQFLQRMIWNTFVDELGKPLYYDYVQISNLPLRRIEELMNQPADTLWDDVRTTQRETMDWIVVRSFVSAVRDLSSHLGPEMEPDWQWGRVHSITFPHVFGRNPLMRAVMNVGPFEIGGSQTTLSNSEWSIATEDSTQVDLATRVAPSMRVISSFRDSVQYMVIPGGSSGQPLNAHYSDQMQLWLKGGYVKMSIRPKPDASFQLYHVFVPR